MIDSFEYEGQIFRNGDLVSCIIDDSAVKEGMITCIEEDGDLIRFNLEQNDRAGRGKPVASAYMFSWNCFIKQGGELSSDFPKHLKLKDIHFYKIF